MIYAMNAQKLLISAKKLHLKEEYSNECVEIEHDAFL